MSTQSRTDKSHDITYPATADARGSTRINHQRRPYYLGPFESPQSYIMFGLWKHRLMETGEPPETKDLRPLVDRLLGEEPATSETFSTAIRKLTSLNFLAACACLSVAIMTTANIFLSLAPAKVDGDVLTAEETEFIRGRRSYDSEIARLQSGTVPVEAKLTARLLEMGAQDAENLRTEDNLLSWAKTNL
jgi:hypothetical protein